MPQPDTKWKAAWNKIVIGWLKDIESLEEKIQTKIKEKWCKRPDMASSLKKASELKAEIKELKYKTKK